MKAIQVTQPGPPEAMQLVEIPTPEPKSNEALVKIEAIGVNFIDVYCRTGYFDLLKPPGVPGMEAAGIIEAE